MLPTRQFAWSTCCEQLLGRHLLCLSFPSTDPGGHIFPNLEFFLHINMDKVLLWSVHSSRNDRCQIKLQNSPTLHSLRSPPINKRILVLLSRKTLLIMAFFGNAREPLLPALQSLHYFAHTLLTPDGKQYSVFKCDYLNSSRNIWGISEWPPVLNWTSPCYRNGLLRIPKNSYSFFLPWDKLQCDPSLVSSMLWALCLQTKWRQNHKYVPRRNTWRLFLPLFSNTAKSLLWSLSSLLYSFAPMSSLSLGSWKSLFSLPITYPLLSNSLKPSPRRGLAAELGFQRTVTRRALQVGETRAGEWNMCLDISRSGIISSWKADTNSKKFK